MENWPGRMDCEADLSTKGRVPWIDNTMDNFGKIYPVSDNADTTGQTRWKKKLKRKKRVGG